MIYIYILINPINGEVFYVGATECPNNRLMAHISESKKLKSDKDRLIRKIIDAGLKVDMELMEHCRYYFTSFWEQVYIDLFSSWGYELLQSQKSHYPIYTYMRGQSGYSNLTREQRREHFDMATDFHNRCINSEPVCVCED